MDGNRVHAPQDHAGRHGVPGSQPSHAPAQPAPSTPLVPRTLFEQALLDHQAGNIAQAQLGYREVLALAPGDPCATHFLGVALHQDGRHDEGLSLVQASLRAQPLVSEWHNTLGNMMSALNRDEEAIAAFLSALQITPGDAVAWNNLGAVLLRQGQVQSAVAALKNATAMDPGFRDALSNLGDALSQAGDPHAAALCYCAEYVLRPAADTERHVLGLAYSQLGRHDDAAQVYAAWLEQDPAHPIAQHLLLASTGKAAPEGASQAYLQSYFDGFADSFESKLLGNLGYQLPAAIAQQLRQLLGTAPHGLRVLDAGCGTGLCGVELRPFAMHLAGVDLSGRALDKAREKCIYDALHQDDITHHLGDCPPASLDLIAAADTLIYFGDISGFLAQAHRALACGGWLVASFEDWRQEHATAGIERGYTLNPAGRYSHHEGYVQACLRQAGFALVRSVPLAIRNELGRPVQGQLVIARAGEG